jgi:hypothetical protein
MTNETATAENPRYADGADDGSRYTSFEAFWPYYLQEHGNPKNRTLHMFGTSASLGVVGVALLRRKPALLPLALVAGYAPAWVGHFFIEKNRPATFKYPLWSLRGDFRMNRMMWSGELHNELRRLGLHEATGEETVDA